MTLPRRSVQLCIIVALSLAAFAVSLGGELVSDDASLIGVETSDLSAAVLGRFWHVRGEGDASGVYGNAYRPFTQLSFALLERAFGADPAPFHLINLLLHACNSLLSWRWLSRRLRAPDATTNPAGELAALLGAVLFAVHPAHAESVAWISGATDLWMTFNLLLGCELLELGSVGRGCAALAFACAVFAKEPAVVAPALCLGDAWARRLPRAKVIGNVALSAGGAGVASAIVLGVGLSGTGGPPAHVDAWSALALTGQYVRAALWPLHLNFEAQPYAVDAAGIHFAPGMVALGAVTWALLLATLVLGVLRPAARALCADAAWFCLLLLPVILLLQSMFSDRFLYAPLLGACALCARGLMRAFEATRAVRYATLIASCVVLALAIPRSVEASKAFADDESLWRSQVRAYPHNPKAIDSFAEALAAHGKYGEARAYFERGLREAHAIGQRAVALHFVAHLIALPAQSRPEWDEAAMAQSAAGCTALFQRHRAQYARGDVRFATDVTQRDLTPLEQSPSLLLLPCTRALSSGRTSSNAVRFAHRAVEVAPEDGAAAETYALTLARTGAYAQALEHAQRALALLGSAQLAELVQRIKAAQEAARALPAPDDTRARALVAFQIAMLLGTPHAARRALEPALLAEPADHDLVHALVQSYVTERRFEPARQAVRDAERAQPGDAYWPQTLQALAEAEAALRSAQPGSATPQGESAKQ